MILRNADFFAPDFTIVRADILVEDGLIREVGKELPGEEGLDFTGCLIAPGFLDIHIHGCVGCDTCDGDVEGLRKMAAHLASRGVAGFCPTTMTVAHEEILKAVRSVRSAMDGPKEGAAVLGVHMEGPFISPHKKGAQAAEFIRDPDFSLFEEYWEASGETIRLVDIAPERTGAAAFIRAASKRCTVSIAHTQASCEEAAASFREGITHATHLFNAMTGFNHREPGVVGAVFDHEFVTAELICDGLHIHPTALRVAFRTLGRERPCVISDSMRAAGLPDGVSELGGQTVYVKDGKATLEDGTIAGSTTDLLTEVQNLIRYGIPLGQILRAVTLNPARVIGLDRELGSIEIGKRACFTVLNKAGFSLAATIRDGEVVYRA